MTKKSKSSIKKRLENKKPHRSREALPMGDVLGVEVAMTFEGPPDPEPLSEADLEELLAEADDFCEKVDGFIFDERRCLLAEKRRIEEALPRIQRAIDRVGRATTALEEVRRSRSVPRRRDGDG